MQRLEVTVEQLESVVMIHAVGPVDSTTAPALQEPLLHAAESPSGALQVDLAQVSYLSSAGMRVLLLAAKALQKRRRTIATPKCPTANP
jgi:anti-sigma B factor antagonist